MARSFTRFLAVALVVGLAACGPIVYRIEVQQGNLVDQETVSQLKPGMTKDQVRFVLGTPLVADIFHADRWDYVFTRKLERSNRVSEERRLTVFFDKNGLLERVEGDVVPGVVPGVVPSADKSGSKSGDQPGPTATR
jgi:outer membrane protein assembly factor BamE